MWCIWVKYIVHCGQEWEVKMKWPMQLHCSLTKIIANPGKNVHFKWIFSMIPAPCSTNWTTCRSHWTHCEQIKFWVHFFTSHWCVDYLNLVKWGSRYCKKSWSKLCCVTYATIFYTTNTIIIIIVYLLHLTCCDRVKSKLNWTKNMVIKINLIFSIREGRECESWHICRIYHPPAANQTCGQSDTWCWCHGWWLRVRFNDYMQSK